MTTVASLLKSLQMLVMSEQVAAIARNMRPDDLPEPAPASPGRGGMAGTPLDAAAIIDVELQSLSLAGLRSPLQAVPLPNLAGSLRDAELATAARDDAAALAAADLFSANASDAAATTSRALAGTSIAAAIATLDVLTQMLATPNLQAERAGIVSSYILNAAMIPGWPAAAGQTAGSEATAAAGRTVPMTEAELATYLANMGVSPELIEELRKKPAEPSRSKKLLLFFATLFTAVGMVIDTLSREFADALAELGDHEERRQRADAPTGESGRQRLYLE